mmetsp:Transcript_60234/g.173811  ORF Transcript_60234/g.173811 Transcript_60234/m.173811 type:complete len:309 (+) Transcript_60234:137-1063(+)
MVGITLIQGFLNIVVTVDHFDRGAIGGFEEAVDELFHAGELQSSNTVHVNDNRKRSGLSFLLLFDPSHHVVNLEHGNKVDGSVQLPDGSFVIAARDMQRVDFAVHSSIVEVHVDNLVPVAMVMCQSGSATEAQDSGRSDMGKRNALNFLYTHLGLSSGPVLVVDRQSRSAADTNAFRKAKRDHTANGCHERNCIHLLDGIAVLELSRIQHAKTSGDQHAGKSRHWDGGDLVGEENNTAEDEASLYQSWKPRLSIQSDIQTRSGDHRCHGHTHEERGTHVGKTLSNQLLIGIVLVRSLLHLLERGARQE